MSDPVREGREGEFLGQDAPAPLGAGDDRPSKHKPEVLQQESNQDEREADDWVLCRRYHSCLAKYTVARFNR